MVFDATFNNISVTLWRNVREYRMSNQKWTIQRNW